MNEKSYIAFAINYYEDGCGCAVARYIHVFDESGNKYKRFKTYEEAAKAAQTTMLENHADSWNVI